MPILVGDGSYPIGPPDGPFDEGLAHIPPGRYRSSGRLREDAFYIVYGAPGTGAGEAVNWAVPIPLFGAPPRPVPAGETIIDIPLQAGWFDTFGFDTWERIDGPHPFYIRMPDHTWRALSPTAPLDPPVQVPEYGWPSGGYLPYPFAVRYTKSVDGESVAEDEKYRWVWEDPYGEHPVRVRMPDFTWAEVTRVAHLGGYPRYWDDIVGFNCDALVTEALGTLDGRRSTNRWGRHVWSHDVNPFLAPEFSGVGVAEGAYLWEAVSNVSLARSLNGVIYGLDYDIARIWYSVDLRKLRWLNSIFNPYGTLTPRLIVRASVNRYERPLGTFWETYVGGGELGLSAASFGGNAETVRVYGTEDHRVPGAALQPSIVHTGPAVPGALLHTFTTPTPNTTEDFVMTLDLSGDAPTLDFQLSAHLPDLPANLESLTIRGSAEFRFALV